MRHDRFCHTFIQIHTQGPSGARARAGQGAEIQKLDSGTNLAMSKGGLNTIKVKINSETPIALTAFILRCLRFVNSREKMSVLECVCDCLPFAETENELNSNTPAPQLCNHRGAR